MYIQLDHQGETMNGAKGVVLEVLKDDAGEPTGRLSVFLEGQPSNPASIKRANLELAEPSDAD